MTWWQKLKQHNRSLGGSRSIKRGGPLMMGGLLLASIALYSESALRDASIELDAIKISTYSDDSSDTYAGDNELLFKLNNHDEEDKGQALQSEKTVTFSEALTESRAGNYQMAAQLYQKIISEKPNHQMAVINLGLLQKKMGDCSTAIKTLERALAISGGTRKGKIYALLGRCHEQLTGFKTSMDYYERSIEFRPGHALTWLRLARVSGAAKRDYNDVIEFFDRAISLNAGDPKTYLAKANYQFLVLDFEGAVKTLKSKLMLASKQSEHLRAISRLSTLSYFEQGKFNKAKQVAKTLRSQLKKVSVRNAQYQFDKALIALTQKQYKKAISLLLKSQLSGSQRDVESLKARIFEMNDQGQQAISVWKTMLDGSDHAYIASSRIASILSEQSGQRQQALDIYQTLLAQPIYRAEVSSDIAKLAIKMNDEVLAYSSVELSRSLRPKKRKYKLLLAQVDSHFGKVPKALESLETLAEAYPKSRKVLRQWAGTLAQDGQTGLSISKFKVLTLNNENKSDLLSLAKLLIQLDKQTEANEVLMRLLEKHNGHIEARYLLAENLCLEGDRTGCQYQAGLVLKLDKNHSGAKQLVSHLQFEKQKG